MFEIVVIILLSFLIWNHLFIFYAPNQWNVINEWPIHSLSIYKQHENCDQTCNVMIHIEPQDIYIFIENGIVIYHHPVQNKVIDELTCPPSHPDRACIIEEDIIPRQICRTSLDILKREKYKYRIHLDRLPPSGGGGIDAKYIINKLVQSGWIVY